MISAPATIKLGQELTNSKHCAHSFPYSAAFLCAGLLLGRGKKSEISRDFQGQIRGKNGRFRGNFAGIFKVSFAEK